MRTLVVGAGDGCYKLAAALGPILRITLAVVLFPRGAQKVFGLSYMITNRFRFLSDPKGIIPGPPWLTPIRSWLVAY